MVLRRWKHHIRDCKGLCWLQRVKEKKEGVDVGSPVRLFQYSSIPVPEELGFYTTNWLSRLPYFTVLSTPSYIQWHITAKPPDKLASTSPVMFTSSPLWHPDTLDPLGLCQLSPEATFGAAKPVLPEVAHGPLRVNSTLEDQEENRVKRVAKGEEASYGERSEK